MTGSKRAVRGWALVAVALLLPSAARAGSEADGGGGGAAAWTDPRTGVEFVRIPGGEFAMGSPSSSAEGPVHRVRVAEFWLARSELTQAQWRRIMGGNPSAHRRCDECPVERVSWVLARAYLARTGYRLPTEAEWEYAAGGGAAHQRWAGTDRIDELAGYAWTRLDPGRGTRPVCTKRPNLFGLCDMTGNVYEWCADWYDPAYYGVSPAEDPRGPASGTLRVARGGSWVLDPAVAGVTLRLSALPTAQHGFVGFRPALAAPPPAGGPR